MSERIVALTVNGRVAGFMGCCEVTPLRHPVSPEEILPCRIYQWTVSRASTVFGSWPLVSGQCSNECNPVQHWVVDPFG